MLRRLHIRNFLLIESMDLELEKGLTIITGETGSGKSVLIGALGLAMGDRAVSGIQRDPEARCVIELEVDTQGLDLKDWFSAQEVTPERYALLRRQIEPGGRSRAFVNDTPVKLEDLRELGERLVHIHSQHHSLLLNSPSFQLGLLDHLAGQQKAAREYSACYKEWRGVERELIRVREAERIAHTSADLVRFQLKELDEAQLLPNEQAELEQELAIADHAEELGRALEALGAILTGDDGVDQALARGRQLVQRAANVVPEIRELMDRLQSVQIEVKDVSDEAESILSGLSVDPERTNRSRERLDLLIRLQQKYRVLQVADLILLAEDLAKQDQAVFSLSEELQVLEKQEALLRASVFGQAEHLSVARAKACGALGKQVEVLLSELGMPGATYRLEHHNVEPGPQGVDVVRAMFTANKDRAPEPLEKVASGGELSRVMLSLIGLVADSTDLPTVIFDEIDTGVSGEVADRVGRLMKEMGRERQVLAITHLPQIASKATTHLVVVKDGSTDSTRTSIHPVEANERVQALAQMLSGRKLTKAALDNARDLLKS